MDTHPQMSRAISKKGALNSCSSLFAYSLFHHMLRTVSSKMHRSWQNAQGQNDIKVGPRQETTRLDTVDQSVSPAVQPINKLTSLAEDSRA